MARALQMNPCNTVRLTGLILMFMAGTMGLPAWAAQDGASTIWTFDDVQAGGLPVGWKAEGIGRGAASLAWAVQAAADAPSKPNVLITRADPTGNIDPDMSYNLFWTDHVIFKDGALAVRLRADAGGQDRGGGIVWRVRDKDNYYLARWNPMEEDFSLYHVKDGTRRTIDSVAVTADTSKWHTIHVRQKGDEIVCSFDGEALLKKRDNTFPAAGGVGLWTKLDVVTAFDDFTVSGAKAR